MPAPQFWSLGGLSASALILIASAANPASDLAPSGLRVASAAFDGPVTAQVVRVIDGDTFVAAAQIWLGQAVEVHVRIEGIDAPELHGKCASERERADVARVYLEERIGDAEVKLSHVRYDKYGGRVDAAVRDAGGDVGAAMIAKNLARPYYGGRRGSWCGAS
jgi:endonuclease YncB( thermonuclease family)